MLLRHLSCKRLLRTGGALLAKFDNQHARLGMAHVFGVKLRKVPRPDGDAPPPAATPAVSLAVSEDEIAASRDRGSSEQWLEQHAGRDWGAPSFPGKPGKGVLLSSGLCDVADRLSANGRAPEAAAEEVSQRPLIPSLRLSRKDSMEIQAWGRRSSLLGSEAAPVEQASRARVAQSPCLRVASVAQSLATLLAEGG